MRQKLAIALLGATILLGGCNSLRVYTIDQPQGNPVTREMAAKLKPGMTPAQVRYVLGSPLVTDTLNPDRWDYIYRFKPGTYAREAGIKPVTGQRLTVWFESGKVVRIEGLESLPEKSLSDTPSRDGTMTADPL